MIEVFRVFYGFHPILFLKFFFLFFFCFFKSRCQDNTVYTASDIWRYSDEYFKPVEYIIAGSAYPIFNLCVHDIKGTELT